MFCFIFGQKMDKIQKKKFTHVFKKKMKKKDLKSQKVAVEKDEQKQFFFSKSALLMFTDF